MTHRVTREWLEEEIARHERLAREATDRRTAERHRAEAEDNRYFLRWYEKNNAWNWRD